MRVVELYKVLNDKIVIMIYKDGENIMWGNPSDIPVGILDCIVKSIRKSSYTTVADIDVVIE